MAKDHYAILRVRTDASTAVIKRAYFRLAKNLHPDLNPSREAHERFLAVKEAYETLSNPVLRREYDERRTMQRPVPTPPPGREPSRVIRVTPPFAGGGTNAVRIRTPAEDRRRRQLAFAYTAVTAGVSVVFLGGSFLLVALGGMVAGVVSFIMGVTLVLLLVHVFPFYRSR